ncbi:MAG: hypothetical protein OEZ06_01660 [Myxococcales bacterium]|nr:hypothetical protein [Myxococcales bacterium]
MAKRRPKSGSASGAEDENRTPPRGGKRASKPPESSLPPPAVNDAEFQADAEALREAKGFRAGARHIWIAVLANLLLGAICLGVPYYRGQQQAQDSLRAFGRVAACLLGGRSEDGLGLGLPIGERDHYAAQVLSAQADWPKRCNAPLQAVAPAEAIFLWPSVKTAGADVRAVIGLVERELEALGRGRIGGHGRISERPLLALAKLRAALTLLAQAAGVSDGLDADALKFESPPTLPQPTRLPLTAGEDASLNIWFGADGVEAIALDGRGISWLRLESGQLDRHRMKRTSLVRGVLRQQGTTHLVWAMPERRCAELEGGCVRRATGIATFGHGARELPTPTWLAGHPASRFDRSLHLHLGQRADLLALLSAEGDLELRRFDLKATPTQASGSEDQPTPPLSPTASWRLPTSTAPEDAALLTTASERFVAWTQSAGDVSELWLWDYEAATPARKLGEAAGAEPHVLTCAQQTGPAQVVLLTDRELTVLDAGTATAPSSAPDAPADPRGDRRVELRLEAPFHAEDPDKDRVRVLCDDRSIWIVGLSVDKDLTLMRCGPDRCDAPRVLAENASGFDVASHAGGLVVASSGARAPQIAVSVIGADGKVRGEATTPGACWDPPAGMCNRPTLTSSGRRLLLAARERSDLLAMEADERGLHWRALQGLKVGAAASTNVSSPMDQHRLRKGLSR